MISEIDFKFPVILGDVIEIGMQTLDIGKSSCTLSCEVRSLHANKTVLTIDKIVYVRVNKYGLPKGHGWMTKEEE
jgi:acyl-CoA thioesterase YciA